MKQILVPTDFSASANNAVEYAVHISRSVKGELVLLHTVAEAGDDGVRKAEGTLAVIASAITGEFPDARVSFHVMIGGLVESLVMLARERRAFMIVMGTNGASKFQNLIFGSNTAAVIADSPCPVLSVPHTATFAKPAKMLFATNLQQDEIGRAAELVALARPFNATVILCHVTLDPEVFEAEEAALLEFARQVSVKTDYPFITATNVAENTVSLGLDILIMETGASIIAFLTHRRGLLEKIYNPSITQKFSAHSDIPLVAYPA